jgi:hypothetical protein
MGMHFEKLRNIPHSLYLFSAAKKGFHDDLSNQLKFVTFALRTREWLGEETQLCFPLLFAPEYH